MRIAKTQLSQIGHKEVARAVEQDLIWSLVACLTTAEVCGCSAATLRYARVVARFEDALVADCHRSLRVPEICNAIRMSVRSLRSGCLALLVTERDADFRFGIAPGRLMQSPPRT
jgi:hypothetical protein